MHTLRHYRLCPFSRAIRIALGELDIEVELTGQPNEYRVYSNFYSYRNRNERDEDVLVGSREDLWRREPDGRLLLVNRTILPKWSVLPSKNLNVFL